MKRIVLLIVMLMGVVTVAQERIPRLIPRDYNNVPAAVPVWYDTTTGTYKYYQDNSASILDALSSGVPVSYDTVSASPVSSSQAYGSWEYKNYAVKFNIMLANKNGYSVRFSDGNYYAINRVDNDIDVELARFSYTASEGDLVRVERTISGIFTLWINGIKLGSCTDNTYDLSETIVSHMEYVTNLTMTPLRTRDLVEDNVKLTYALLGSTNSYSQFITSTSAAVGEVDFGFETQSVTFINDGVTTDTLYVSTSNTFPATNTIVRLGGEGFTKRMKTNKLYFKVGNVPLAGKKIRIEGY